MYCISPSFGDIGGLYPTTIGEPGKGQPRSRWWNDDGVRRLLTIPISHFCEKARWALERAGLGYVEERHVQGIHQRVARRAGGGKTMPVLVADEGVFPESEDILLYADARVDREHRLFPADGESRGEVLDLCRWLDEGLGPDGRRLMYAHMLPQKKLMLRFNNQGVPKWEDWTMTALWPVITRFASRELALTPTTIQDDEPRVWHAFDAIAERLADGRRHLCGDRFTAADLTFACLSAAVLVPPEYGVPLPQPEQLHPDLARDIRRFREHPAGEYALELFRTERRAPAVA
jgi:glutathione S-transferase